MGLAYFLYIKALTMISIFIEFKEVTREKSHLTGFRGLGWGEDRLAPKKGYHKAKPNQEGR